MPAQKTWVLVSAIDARPHGPLRGMTPTRRRLAQTRRGDRDRCRELAALAPLDKRSAKIRKDTKHLNLFLAAWCSTREARGIRVVELKRSPTGIVSTRDRVGQRARRRVRLTRSP